MAFKILTKCTHSSGPELLGSVSFYSSKGLIQALIHFYEQRWLFIGIFGFHETKPRDPEIPIKEIFPE